MKNGKSMLQFSWEKCDPCCSIPRKKRQWIVQRSLVILVDFVQLWAEKDGKTQNNMQQCTLQWGLPRWLSGREATCQRGRCRFEPWAGKSPWRRELQSTPIFLPGKSHGQRSLAGYGSWGRKESDTTERLSTTLQ